MKSKITAFLASALLSLLAGTAPQVQAEPAQEFVLGNGLKLIVKQDRRAPTAVQMVWYKVGGIDELNGTTGVSHALEHMMFKGTKQHKVGEFSRLVAELGGQENAFTANDFTAYFQQIEKSHLEQVMALEADRMANLQFDANEFAKEIRVIMEERRWRTDDQPMGLLNEALNAAAWTAHPYHHPVVGWMDDLQHMTVQDIAHWYRQWYAPNNATLVVAGDVEPQRVLALARKYFGKIPAHPLPQGKPQNEPEQRGMRRVTVKAPAENPYVVMAWKVPALRQVEADQDAYALDVLSAVLDGYDNARLSAQLVRTASKATAVGASYSGVARGPVLFTLEGSPANGVSTEELEGLLRAEVERIAREGVSEQELQRVKRQLIASQIYKRDSVFGQAMEMGMMETIGLGQQNIDRLIERLKSVTAAQVQAVAQKYFKDDTLTVATLVPLPLEGKKPAAPPAGLLH
ncbi:M16 family metallopeptidase [Herbaspirillum rubrisubalbicans]|uniref:Insulinase family protein n=1 Tax=Herbaspirillum rubrisubalbicans Os34 TaxID=1235827 RepID=A0A6M3ZYX9_9BURK|nr:pitrilysin family protein [Herbaspirillum rubrisubalbicans]QJQ03140.1 insulinase family protein [Herbaspirillum rubrisubalbicans Os34]